MTAYLLLLALYGFVALAGWSKGREPSAPRVLSQGLSLAPLLFLCFAQVAQIRSNLAGEGSPYLRDFVEVPQFVLLLAAGIALPSVFLPRGRPLTGAAIGVRSLQVAQVLVIAFLGSTLGWLASRMQ